jgi:hypothetical protein
MRQIKPQRYLALLVFISLCSVSSAQSVPMGIFYQAVARDNFGKEIVNKNIDVRFSIITGDPLGEIVFQELHSHVTTSRYGVFTLVIGHGTPTGSKIYGELSQINWNTAYHYLKVEVKFESIFIDMGTMQFLAVPYALYAQKSLEPGPSGPKGDPGQKGDPGDPASDDQILSFDQSNLTISGGNSVPLTSLLQNLTITSSPEGNYLGISRGNSVLVANIENDGDPINEIQDLIYDGAKRELRLLKSTAPAIDLTELKDDADADPANEIQDLFLAANTLTITNKTNPTEIDLAPYMDNTDNQVITYNESDNTLSITNGTPVSLGTTVAFRARKQVSETGLAYMSDYDFIAGDIAYNDGGGYNDASGLFIAPAPGIYTFNVGFTATGTGDARALKVFLNDNLYDILNSGITSNTSMTRSVTMKLVAGDTVKVVINTGSSNETGTGSFSGYKVH